jgi:hypothetical protein
VALGGEQVDTSIEGAYPHLAEWVKLHGWIEIGHDDHSRSFIRALDIGGMVWEGKETYTSLDAALQDVEEGLGAWMSEQFGTA